MSLPPAFQNAITVPTRFGLLNPHADTPILLFTSNPMPSLVEHIDENAAILSMYSLADPSPGLSNAILLTTPIPPRSLLVRLIDLRFARWSEGFHSIQWQGRSFPLWSLDWWLGMIPAAKAHARWASCYDRAHSCILTRNLPPRLAHVKHGVESFFNTVGWNSDLGSYNLTATSLIPLFTEDQLACSLLDHVVRLFREWSSQSEFADHSVYLETLDIQFPFSPGSRASSVDWENFDTDRSGGPLTHLRSIADKVRSGQYSSIIAPLHAQTCSHWIVVHLDATHHSLLIGDSLHHSHSPVNTAKALSPSNLRGLRAFAQKLGFNIEEMADILPHSFQPFGDGHSCGDIALNTIERKVFPNMEPWSPELKHVLRAEWALVLATGRRSPFTLVS